MNTIALPTGVFVVGPKGTLHIQAITLSSYVVASNKCATKGRMRYTHDTVPYIHSCAGRKYSLAWSHLRGIQIRDQHVADSIFHKPCSKEVIALIQHTCYLQYKAHWCNLPVSLSSDFVFKSNTAKNILVYCRKWTVVARISPPSSILSFLHLPYYSYNQAKQRQYNTKKKK